MLFIYVLTWKSECAKEEEFSPVQHKKSLQCIYFEIEILEENSGILPHSSEMSHLCAFAAVLTTE